LLGLFDARLFCPYGYALLENIRQIIFAFLLGAGKGL